jgi:ABC-type phosphate transport system auxiliary subunit
MSPHDFHWSLVTPIIFVAVIFGARSFRHWLRFKERQLELTSEQAAEKAAQYAAKTERLEQRVAVLERILTDRSGHLADEIERLREAPLN